jgi:hypothetical protein
VWHDHAGEHGEERERQGNAIPIPAQARVAVRSGVLGDSPGANDEDGQRLRRERLDEPPGAKQRRGRVLEIGPKKAMKDPDGLHLVMAAVRGDDQHGAAADLVDRDIGVHRRGHEKAFRLQGERCYLDNEWT